MSADVLSFLTTDISHSAQRKEGINKDDIKQIETFVREYPYTIPHPRPRVLTLPYVHNLLLHLEFLELAVQTPVRWVVFCAPEIPYQNAGRIPPGSREVLQNVFWHLFFDPCRNESALAHIIHSVKHGELLTPEQINEVCVGTNCSHGTYVI